MDDTVFYILVKSATDGMALFEFLKKQGCRTRIAPVPRGLTACCGMSLLVTPEDMAQVREHLDAPESPGYERIVEMENRIDPHRDRYC
ncbi:MAG: DUF3343 domain-containing protein [Coriobacteriaceae bacterium]|nr:DUF3343 domain-containing protein [Coriobacteriaceae bacterium]